MSTNLMAKASQPSRRRTALVHPNRARLLQFVEGHGATAKAIERHVRDCVDCARAVTQLCAIVRERADIALDVEVGAVVARFDATLEPLANIRRTAAQTARTTRRSPSPRTSRGSR